MADEEVAVGETDVVENNEDTPSDEDKQLARLKEAIIVDKEDIGALRLKLTVTVPRDVLDERFQEQFKELKRDAMVPGFRKGHAPMALVEKRFRADVGHDLASQLVTRSYLAAVDREGLKPLGDPLFWVTVSEERVGDDGVTRKVESEKLLPAERAVEAIKIPKTGPLTFSCEIELKPEFELPNLKRIPIERPALSVDETDVDAEVNRLRASWGVFQPVEDGGIETDDLLFADMTITVDDDVIVRERDTELAARDLRIYGIPLVGFGDAVAGCNVNDDVVFEADVPNDHDDGAIRGRRASFRFTIREIKRMVIPPVDEAFLRRTGFETEAELRAFLRSTLEHELESEVRRAMHEQIGRYLVEHTTLDVPDTLSRRQTDRSIARRMIEMQRAKMPQAEIDKHVDEMKAKAHEQAVRDIKLFFIMDRIADERDVDVREDEINGAIAAIARQRNRRFDRVRDELSKAGGLTALYFQLRDDKILDALLAGADITDAPVHDAPKSDKPPAPSGKTKTKATARPKRKAAGAAAAPAAAANATEPVAKKSPGAKAGGKKPAAKKPATKTTGTKDSAGGKSAPKKTAARADVKKQPAAGKSAAAKKTTAKSTKRPAAKKTPKST